MDFSTSLIGVNGWTWLSLATGLVCCVAICIQDFKSRWVHIVPLILLGLAGTGLQWLHFPNTFLPQLGFNLTFVTALVGLAYVYLRLRGLSLLKSLGLGDVLFFYMAAPWFTGIGYLYFFIVGIVLALLIVLAGQATGKLSRNYPIPLAGWLAAWGVVFQFGYSFLPG